MGELENTMTEEAELKRERLDSTVDIHADGLSRSYLLYWLMHHMKVDRCCLEYHYPNMLKALT